MKFAFVLPVLAAAASGVLPAAIPLHFEPYGTTFVARTPGYVVQMGREGAAVGLRKSRLLLRMAGGDLSRLEGVSKQSAVSNYLNGRDAKRWRQSVPHYARVRYAQVYPGVDLEFYGNSREIEYDFILAPDADASRIRMEIGEARSLSLSPAGDLRMEAPSGETVTLRAPVAFQRKAGTVVPVESRFALAGNTVSFALGDYDHSLPLTIDPVLSFATYFGASGTDVPTAIAVDTAGNTYITGYTNSTNFPLAGDAYAKNASGDEDVFVTKLNASGNQLIYSTYLGGSAGERPVGIAVNLAGQATIAGNTASLNYPHFGSSIPLPGIGLFVTRLSADGSQIAGSLMMSYSETENLGTATALAADSSGNLYLAGHTGSAAFPATTGSYQQSLRGDTDAFVAKILPNLSGLVYATFLGGTAQDQASAITVDAQGNAYVTGLTRSSAFPFTPGAYLPPNRAGADVFVSRLSSDGKLLDYSALLGGSGDDYGRTISLGPGGAIYVAGLTLSTNYVTTSGAYQTLRPQSSPNAAFVTRLSPAMDTVQYSTYFGAPTVYFNVESVTQILVDQTGSFLLGGYGLGNGLPLTPGPIQSPAPGLNDVFLAQFNAAGDLLNFSTYLGGSGNDTLAGMVLDSAGFLYLAGSTTSTNFPATAGAYRATNQGGTDGFVAKIDFGGITTNCTAALVTSSYTGGAEGGESTFDFTINNGCAWSVSSNQTWVTITSAASGTGSATVTFRLDINTTASNRTATITVAGKTFSVTQTGTPCNLIVTPGNRTIPSTGGAMTFTVNGLTGCTWTATTATPWLLLQGSVTGNGSGLVPVSFDTNTAVNPRSGLLTIAKQGVYVLQPAAVPQSAFVDVSPAYLFNDYISLMKLGNVADFCNGDPAQFCPENATTRATMALYIIRALYGGDTFTFRAQPYFTDVPSTHPQFPHIQKMRELGYTAGCTATTYCPNDNVTRGQMAAFIVRTKLQRRYDQTITFPAIPFFTDVLSTDIFYPYIQKMKELGVTSGCTETTFCQWDTNTRGQMAVFVVRALLTQ
ncbi:MAG: SBBP repeat-containing protein [Bryobacteraceae bacterium]